MFLHDPLHTAVPGHQTLSDATAPNLHTARMLDTGAWNYSSPVIVTNPAGHRLVYEGNQSGAFLAYDADTGALVWSTIVGHGGATATPAYDKGSLFWGASNHNMYKLDADTGAIECSFDTGGIIDGSAVVADPGDGKGARVYFGDVGLSGGSADGGSLWALHASDCTKDWSYDQFGDPAGSGSLAGVWSSPAYVTDARGRNVLVVGSGDPDSAIYSFDATTGKRLWRYGLVHGSIDDDVGASPAIMTPGTHGQADGIAYIAGKDHHVVAVDLTTGALRWDFNIDADTSIDNGTNQSSPTLKNTTLYLGYGSGAYALNALTGAVRWRFQTPSAQEVASSIAISGPKGHEALVFGDLSGMFWALRATDGAVLWSYRSGNFVFSSAAISKGQVFIGSSDGFLYEFMTAPDVSARPTVTVTSPDEGDVVTYPSDGRITVTGTATDDKGVTSVMVAARKGANRFYDPASKKWTALYVSMPATLSNPGGTSTTWSITYPLDPDGGPNAVGPIAFDADGQESVPVVATAFSVTNLVGAPETTITSPVYHQVFNLPNPPAEFSINTHGTATDDEGAHPGVKEVDVTIFNIQHNEYWCGPSGCPGDPGDDYSPAYHVVKATLSAPNATSTDWSLDFTVMDHPHDYRVNAWAIDLDGNNDESKAVVSRICVRQAGSRTCASP
jgi:outer membrane protein assembly factor BamB